MRNPKAPPKVGNKPLRVMSGIYIESMGKFKAEEMVSMYSVQSKAVRLRHLTWTYTCTALGEILL